MLFGPRLRREVFDLPVGGGEQPGQDLVQIGIRIESMTATAFDEGVEDGTTFPSLGFANEQPISCCSSSIR